MQKKKKGKKIGHANVRTKENKMKNNVNKGLKWNCSARSNISQGAC